MNNEIVAGYPRPGGVSQAIFSDKAVEMKWTELSKVFTIGPVYIYIYTYVCISTSNCDSLAAGSQSILKNHRHYHLRDFSKFIILSPTIQRLTSDGDGLGLRRDSLDVAVGELPNSLAD